MEPFKAGSMAILDDLINLTKNGVTTSKHRILIKYCLVAGGGDTVALI